MEYSPHKIHDVVFAATAFVPVWLPILALAVFWRKIDKKLFYVVGGVLASAGIQHAFSFMHLFQISQGATLINEKGNWSELAIQTFVLAVPGILLSIAYLYWSMKLLSTHRPNSPLNPGLAAPSRLA